MALAAAFVLLVSGVTPGAASVRPPGPDAGAAPAPALPASAVDETKVPHYFGPYPNWANSPLTAPDATVTITASGLPVTPITVGNPLVDRANATDYATTPGTLAPVFVVLAAALPAGTLDSFKVWNQTVPGGSPNTSEGNLFHAYVLRPTGAANQYTLAYDSGLQTMPASLNPAGEVATFAAGVPVQAGDMIGFYGEGVPVDVGGGTDILSYPATANADLVTPGAPAQGGTITLGTDPGFPVFSQDRTYSFAAVVTPPGGTPAGAGAAAEATVGANGAITGLTITNPGHDYASANVAITGAGSGATAEAVVQTSGAVTGISVGNGGAGYTAPSVTITGGGATTDATAHALGGVDVVSIVVPGEGYKFPTVDFDLPDDPNGLQAQGHATCAAPYPDCNLGTDTAVLTVTGVVVDSSGSGYATAPAVVIRDGTQFDPINHDPATFTEATAAATLTLQSVVVDTFGAGYTSAPTVDFTDIGSGTGASATAATDFGTIIGLNLLTPGSGYITAGGIKKFVDGLPGLTEAGANNLGQYIPVAQPDTQTFPGTDYYVIGVMQYRERMSSSLPTQGTLLRGYVQLSTGVIPGKQVPLVQDNLDGTTSPVMMPDGVTQAVGVDNPHYLGPTIVASKDRAVRIVFYNLLPTGAEGDLFLPTDSTLMGSGAGPQAMPPAADFGTVMDEIRNPICSEYPKSDMDCFVDNRATLHLHGGVTPWISDGTPHQWITPANQSTPWPEGVSVENVPDMVGASRPTGVPDCNAATDGCQTFYYTNQQSARLMFYHDHAWGITRLNVYAGEAAGYVITDPTEQKLFGAGRPYGSMGEGIPLIIQDRTFVPGAAQLAQQDPTWDVSRWGGEGSLWYHHVYMPAQNPGDPGGMSAYGRWMYGPWFWPPATPPNGPIDNPYYNMDPKGPDGTRGTADDFSTPLATPCSLDNPATWQYDVDPFCEPAQIPGTPNISVGMEQFNDTPLVNGTAYPTTTLDPKSYRFRILNAANDRFWNLSWYVADNNGTPNDPTDDVLTEVALNASEVAAAQTDLNVVPTPDTKKSPAGPSWIQIGTEGGFLPAPTVVPAQPTTWITDPTRFDVGNVDKHSLLLAPAERADVIVDFSKYAGKTLILYNDAPAAFPARVPSYDYFTGGPDTGAGVVLPGYGPNTRTVMQVKIAAKAPASAFNVTALRNLFTHKANGTGVFEEGQHPIIVGQAAYNSAYGSTFAASGNCTDPNGTNKCDGFARINQQGKDLFRFDNLKKSNPQLKIPLQPKAIHDEMNSAAFDEFGRMTANLGLEAVPATPALQNVTLYPYIAPPTEVIDGTNLPKGDVNVQAISDGSDGTQIWKITHNGVDTHPIHFHLYDVQVLNRVTWDNIIIPAEASELGWKDTVRISPLEDTIVALRPIIPTLPFEIPNSIRNLSPMMPGGSNLDPLGLIVDPAGNVTTVTNALVNFGWEYVYHCHILSHEEMDMMRPVLLAVPPLKADTLVFDRATKTLTWNDNSITETSFDAQVSTDSGATWTTFGTIQSPLDQPNIHQSRSLVYPAYDPNTIYQFHIVAKNTVGYGGAYPQVSVLSVSTPLTVGLPTTTTLTSDINPSNVGQLVTFTATVSPAAATGTVEFREGATLLGTGTLAGGVATFATSTLAAGTHTITAAYLGTLPYEASTSAPYDQVVVKTGTATVVLGAPNPSFVGDSVTFTATVTPAAATGTVTFSIDGVDVAAPALAAGVATYSTSSLAFGLHPIIATYGGDAAYLPSSDTITQIVNKIPTTTTLVGVPNPSLFGQDVVFTATVSPSAAAGTVTFTVDGAASAPVALVTGEASFTATGLGVGSHIVIAAYSGDATYVASTSAPFAQGVGRALTTTTVSSDINPSDLGQQVTFTATVAPAAATGTVEFFDGATSLGAAPLSAGSASFAITSLAVGTHSITAAYSGDIDYAASSSTAITQTVNQVATSIVVVGSPNPSILGQSVTFTATLSASAATGSVEFFDNGVSLGSGTVSTGSATLSTAGLAVGDHPITATYGGDATYLGSTSAALTQTVNKVPTTTLVLSNPNPSVLGQSVTFAASVAPAAATGTVEFFDGAASLGTAPLSGGTAAVSTATLVVGLHTITAVYSGDATHATSTSAGYTQTVDPIPAPSNLVAVAVSSTQINLAWLDNAPSETGFTLQRATNLAFTSGLNTITLAANTNIYTNTGRNPSTTYYYRIQAFNALGVSAWSNIANAFTAVIGSPTAPSNLNALAISKAQIDLAWTDNATDETGYTIQRSASATFTGVTTITQNVVDLTAYSDLGRTANTTYFYRVRAFNATGPSAWSNTAFATTLPLAPPAAPSGLSATAVSPSQIDLTWTDNANNETGFTIQRSTSPAFAGVTTITQNVVNLVAYSNTGRAQNTTYYYRVRAFNADGFSTWSNTASATTPPAVPAVPAGLTVTPAAAGSLDVAWTYTSNGALGPITFTVQRSNSGGGGWTTVATGISPASFTDTGLPANTTRFYRVRAVNGTGTSAWSTVASGTTLP